MKKTISFLIIIVVILLNVFFLTGCNNNIETFSITSPLPWDITKSEILEYEVQRSTYKQEKSSTYNDSYKNDINLTKNGKLTIKNFPYVQNNKIIPDLSETSYDFDITYNDNKLNYDRKNYTDTINTKIIYDNKTMFTHRVERNVLIQNKDELSYNLIVDYEQDHSASIKFKNNNNKKINIPAINNSYAIYYDSNNICNLMRACGLINDKSMGKSSPFQVANFVNYFLQNNDKFKQESYTITLSKNEASISGFNNTISSDGKINTLEVQLLIGNKTTGMGSVYYFATTDLTSQKNVSKFVLVKFFTLEHDVYNDLYLKTTYTLNNFKIEDFKI